MLLILLITYYALKELSHRKKKLNSNTSMQDLPALLTLPTLWNYGKSKRIDYQVLKQK